MLSKEKVVEELKKLISTNRNGTYKKIPAERELAELYNVSRTTIRNAIKELIKEGQLIQIQGKGTYITPGIKSKEVHIICSPDIKRNDPFYNKLFGDITDITTKESINLLLITADSIPNDVKDIPVIVVGIIDDNLLQILKDNYKVVITLEEYINHNDIIQISFDDYKIGWNAANLLIEYGYDNIIHLAGPDKYTSSLLRKNGFIDRIKKEEYIQYEIISGKMNWSSGYKLADIVLERYMKCKKPIAVFAANDWMAVGLIQRLKEEGIKIGSDISIIGCDNIFLSSEIVPSLTTFDWDLKNLMLEILQLINNNNLSAKKILLTADIVMRETLKKKKDGPQ